MIITGDDEVILGNKAETKKFSITTSAKAFKILSSGLYKNKIRAIVRELACNCTDAHFLNGFQGAFDIQVPGQLDPRFIIRDYGPGLSKDGLENLYTTYFSSTKNGSNDFIGALGLGSKSPFSYTDTFTVVSYHNGRAYGYTAMLDNGEPVIRPLFDEPMNEGEKTGLEITVPVKPNDVSRWKEEIAYVVRPFGADKVNLIGSSLKVDFFEPFEEYFGVNNPDYSHPERQGGLFAVYGNIVYPLNDVPGLGNTWLTSRNTIAYVRFPLGELDIAASREELSLDETTIANIKSRVFALDKRVMAEDLKEFQESDDIRGTYRNLQNLGYKAKQMITNTKFTKYGLTEGDMYRKVEVPNAWTSAGVCYEVALDPRMKRIKSSTNSASVGLNRLFGYQTRSITIVIDDSKKDRLPSMRALFQLHRSRVDSDIKIVKENQWLPKSGEDVLFINKESQFEMDLLPELLIHFDKDPVTILYTSEIFNLVSHHVPKKDPQAPSEKRPKAPTALRYYKDAEDRWCTEELLMTAAEAADIDGPVVFRSGHNHLFLNAEYGQVYNANEALFRHGADSLGIREFYMLRPTLHKKILKVNQCEDMMAAILDKFVELIDEVDYDYYVSTGGRSWNYTRHIDKYPKLGFLIRYLNEAGKKSPEASALFTLRSWINPISVTGCVDEKYRDIANRGCQIIQKLNQFAERRAQKLLETFEKEHLVVSHFLRYNGSLDEAEVDEVVKLMGE